MILPTTPELREMVADVVTKHGYDTRRLARLAVEISHKLYPLPVRHSTGTADG